MPPDQYDYIVKEVQALAVTHTRQASSISGHPNGTMRTQGDRRHIDGGVPAGPTAAAWLYSPISLVILILGLLLSIALLWRGWNVYHAGQVIDNATSLLHGLAGSDGQQATSFFSSLMGNPRDYEAMGQAIMIAGAACAVATAFAFARPQISAGGFGVAALIALSVTGSGVGDITLFGIGAAALACLSIVATRKHL